MKKTKTLVVNLESVRQAAQAYVQALTQLFILGSVPHSKIYSSPLAIDQLEKQRTRALNYQSSRPILISCNIRSLPKHFDDFVSSSCIKQSQVICLQETWLQEGEHNEDKFDINCMGKHFVVVGFGRGIATYWTEDFRLNGAVKCQNFQITKVSSVKLDVINIYRSSAEDNLSLIQKSARTAQ